MCWSGEASACLAATGFISTAYFFRQGESKTLCMALGYFSLMELLQAYTYTVIDQCANPRNQVATLLGYIHITFQPFFINAVAMHFLPEHVRKQIATWVYALCGIAAMIFIMRIYPFAWAEFCYEKSYQLLMGAGLSLTCLFADGKSVQHQVAGTLPGLFRPMAVLKWLMPMCMRLFYCHYCMDLGNWLSII